MKENEKKIFSRNLSMLLSANGMSQVELANTLSCSETQISLWLSHKHGPSPKYLKKIAKAFHVQIGELTTDPEKKPFDPKQVAQALSQGGDTAVDHLARIESLLTELVDLERRAAHGPQFRMTAESGSVYEPGPSVTVKVPEEIPPHVKDETERDNWPRNVETMRWWLTTPLAATVHLPPWAVETFLRENTAAQGHGAEHILGVFKDILDRGPS